MLQVCAVDFTAYHLLGPLLRASREDGWTVEFSCADGPFAARLRDEGFAHRRIPMTRSASPRRQAIATLALARSLQMDPPDLIHTHTPAGGLVGRAAAGLAFGGPVLHTFHGLPFPGRPTGVVERSFLAVERLLSRRTAIFFSQARGDVERAVELGIARRADTLVIGNGVDVRQFTPDASERARVRAELALDANAIVVLMVARMVREKGVLELADAALRLKDDPRIYFLIAGAPLPSDRTGVERELAEHPVHGALGTRWKHLGHRVDVDALLKASDIFTLPSYREGLPRSVIEAMATGVPVVTTDIPACRELVADSQAGLLVPVRSGVALAGAIGALVADPALRQAMGRRGHNAAAAEHDERVVLRRQLAVFRQYAPQ